MIIFANQMKEESDTSGFGNFTVKTLLQRENLYPNAKKVALVKIMSGNAVDFHIHTGDMDAYIIVSGRGIYSDNGLEKEISEGDVCIAFDGEGHAIRPLEGETLQFIAIMNEI